jgi:hypothetical protein
MMSHWTLIAAGNDVWSVIVPILTIVFFVVVNVFRGLSESAANAPKKGPRPPGTPQNPRRAGGSKDLEKLLEDLGLRRPEASDAKPPAPAPAQTQAKKYARKPVSAPRNAPPQRLEPAAQAPKESLQRRHLHSDIEERHASKIQSSVETQHLPSQKRPLSSIEASSSASHSSPETSPGLGLFANPDDVTRAFMLQTILGPPIALQPERE